MMETFFLKTLDHKCLGLTKEGLVGVVGMDCNWTPGLVPDSFWFWDGISNLILKAPERNVNGSVIDLVNYSILPPTGPGYVKIARSGGSGVILTSAGNVYSSDYSLCLTVEEETEKLRWIECTGAATVFSMEQPQHCGASKTKCSSNADCCPPFGSCVSGQCSTCFGDPIQFQQKNCPGPANYVVCGENGAYKCKSHCDGMTKSCDEGFHSVCSIKPDGGYELICEVLCEGNAPKCESDIARCKNISPADAAPHYEWACPIDYCKDPLSFPHADSAPAPNGYRRVGDHFEVLDGRGDESWLYPEWQCEKATGGKWIYTKGCNLNVHQKCDAGSSGVCNAKTNFEWACQPNTGLDMCGVQSKPGCPDAICVDSVCDSGATSGNGWKWICPSSDQMSTCEAANYAGWLPSTAAGYGGTIYTDNAGNPVYPTINESKCRSPVATVLHNPDLAKKVSNPKGSIGPTGYTPFPTYFNGDADYIYTTYEYNNVEWKCPTHNPCSGKGTYTNLNGSPYQPFAITPAPGQTGSPTEEDLLSKGKCACLPGYAGNKCQYSGTDKCNGGTIRSCNDTGDRCVDGQYSCVCPPGTYGRNCQFTEASCNGNGIPDNNSDILKCSCILGYNSSDNCSKLGCPVGSVASPASIPVGVYNLGMMSGEYVCSFGPNGTDNGAPPQLDFGFIGYASKIVNLKYDNVTQRISLDDGRVLVVDSSQYGGCAPLFRSDYQNYPHRFIMSYGPNDATYEYINHGRDNTDPPQYIPMKNIAIYSVEMKQYLDFDFTPTSFYAAAKWSSSPSGLLLINSQLKGLLA
jgi:hypothetical protein